MSLLAGLVQTVFKIDFKLHSIEVTGEDEVTACWTMGMLMPLLPWRPNLMFTGRTFYKVRWEAVSRKRTHVLISFVLMAGTSGSC